MEILILSEQLQQKIYSIPINLNNHYLVKYQLIQVYHKLLLSDITMEPQQIQKNDTKNRQSTKRLIAYKGNLILDFFDSYSNKQCDSKSTNDISEEKDIQNMKYRDNLAHQIENVKDQGRPYSKQQQIEQQQSREDILQKMCLAQEINDKEIDMFYRNNINRNKYFKNRFYVENIRGHSKIGLKETFKLTQTHRALLNWTTASNFRKDQQMNREIFQLENQIRSQNQYLRKDPINIYQSGTKGGRILRFQEALQKYKIIRKSEIQKKRQQQYMP